MDNKVLNENASKVTPKFPMGIVLGLALTILLDATIQLTWKAAVSKAAISKAGHSASVNHTLRSMLHQPLTIALIALFLAQFVNWVTVLGKVDLSFAQPITTLSYVLTCIGSALIFGDHIPLPRIAGIALILIGVWFVSGTTHRTAAAAKALP